MIGRRARCRGGWMWVALAWCGTACGGNVESGGATEEVPGPGETPDDPLPTRAFEVEAGPADVDDPDEVQAFTVPPGDEEWICFTGRLDNPERVQARTVAVHRGSGVSRVDVNAVHDDRNTGLDPCEAHLPYVPLHADGLPGFDPDVPENAGLAFELPPRATVTLWMHAVNVTDGDVLARATVRLEEAREPATRILRPLLWTVPEPDAHGQSDEQIEIGDECVVESERRIAALATHTHDARTLSSQVTLEQAPSASLLYSQVGQVPMPAMLFYDPLRSNETSDDLAAPTGVSRVVAVRPGDRLRYGCAFDADVRPAKLPRDFACMVFGSYTAEPGSEAVWRCE